MRSESRKPLLSWIILGLLVLNLGALAWLYIQPRPMNTPQKAPGRLLIEALQLNPTQQAQFTTLERAHRSQRRQIQVQARQARRAMGEAIASGVLDEEKIQSIADNIGQYQAQLEAETMRHFLRVRAICKPEQQIKFDQLIQRVLRQGARPGQEGPRRPGVGPPPQKPGR